MAINKLFFLWLTQIIMIVAFHNLYSQHFCKQEWVEKTESLEKICIQICSNSKFSIAKTKIKRSNMEGEIMGYRINSRKSRDFHFSMFIDNQMSVSLVKILGQHFGEMLEIPNSPGWYYYSGEAMEGGRLIFFRKVKLNEHSSIVFYFDENVAMDDLIEMIDEKNNRI